MSKLRVAVAGATGYAGAACVALLAAHPGVELVQVTSRSRAGLRHSEVYPGSRCDLTMAAEVDPARSDLVISALGHTESAREAPAWLEQGRVVIDISAGFRLRRPEAFAAWYGAPHPAPELLAEAVLALPELDPAPLLQASLIALPGCFSTAAILACGPAAAAGVVEPQVVVDGKTGISGAGRSATSDFLFSEINESVRAYAVAGHRHQPEMEQALSGLAEGHFQVTFVPHLVPMTRGIVVTCYLRPKAGVEAEEVAAVYRERYQESPFIRLLSSPPQSKLASHTNLCFLHLQSQGPHLVVTAALDNLGRGAASQALQVMNLRFGLDPRAGLGAEPQWP